MTTLGGDVIMRCRIEDMSKPSNQEAMFVWTRQDDSDWRVENDGNPVVTIETFCIDEYYCTPQNRAGSGPRGSIQLSGTLRLILSRRIYLFILV